MSVRCEISAISRVHDRASLSSFLQIRLRFRLVCCTFDRLETLFSSSVFFFLVPLSRKAIKWISLLTSLHIWVSLLPFYWILWFFIHFTQSNRPTTIIYGQKRYENAFLMLMMIKSKAKKKLFFFLLIHQQQPRTTKKLFNFCKVPAYIFECLESLSFILSYSWFDSWSWGELLCTQTGTSEQ